MILGESAQSWDDIWEHASEVNAPRFVWPDVVKEIARAYAGTTDEEMETWPPPTEEITFTKLCEWTFGDEARSHGS